MASYPLAPPVVTDESALLARILAERAVFPVFQPIVDLASRKIVGVEALARGPAGSSLEFPDALFATAGRGGLLTELDQMSCERALVAAREAGAVTPPLVFVNREPAALDRPMSPELAAAIYRDLPFSIVVEFTERALATAPAALLRATDAVHGFGNAVALDDVGADPLSLAFLPLVEPAVVKLDMQLVRAPHEPGTLATAAAVSAFAERSAAVVLAEGIETEQDAANAAALGARWGQGWLFGRPGPMDAIAGRPVESPASFRRVDFPSAGHGVDSAFALSSRRGGVRLADRQMIDAMVGLVLDEVGAGGSHTVLVCVLGAGEDLPAWLPRLRSLNARTGYMAVLTPLPLPAMAGMQTAAPDRDDPMNRETAIVFLDVHRTMAFCLGPPDPGSDRASFTLTEDRDLVQNIARTILRRFPSW
jgi:EAL domain-containing protein (putative c-di-GMP-specific phosphodiesterase class I)